MYEHIEDVMVDESKVAERLDEPVWMNKNGEVVSDEKDSVGAKVTARITRPDMCIVLDEVGCNLSQEYDNSKGGQLFVCGVDDEPYNSISTKYNHFTCLGLTRLDGEALMCVVIIQGKKRDMLTESGIDWTQLTDDVEIDNILDGEEAAFFESNYGEGKLFPGPPSCYYKGVEVPALVVFNESGGMDGEILTTIFKRLDKLKLYESDRENGVTPFVLLDGHQSRFDIDFLSYINDNEHKWNVCLDVPYGTALWQVADSSQQNGKYKMLLNEKIKELFTYRLSLFQSDLSLMRTDIIPIVNWCWPCAFADVQNNIKAICERGWNPLSRALLFDNTIRAIITQEMLKWETEYGPFSESQLKKYQKDLFYTDDGNGMISVKTNIGLSNAKHDINLDCLTAQYVTNTIILETDRQIARQHIQKLKTEGMTLRE